MTSNLDRIISKKLDDYCQILSSLKISESKIKMIETNWCDSIRLMELLTKKHYVKYNIVNLTIIIGSVLSPVTINILPDPMSKIIATILGVMVSIAAGLSQSYRFNDRWKHFRKISEDLKIEGEKFITLSGDYRTFSDHENESYKLFMANIAAIKQGQIIDYFKKIEPVLSKNEEKK